MIGKPEPAASAAGSGAKHHILLGTGKQVGQDRDVLPHVTREPVDPAAVGRGCVADLPGEGPGRPAAVLDGQILRSGTTAAETAHDVVMTGVPTPWRLFFGWLLLATSAGALWGFFRGLHYLPTLPFALVEGAIIFGVPASLLGLLVIGCWYTGTSLRRRGRRHPHHIT